MPESPVAMDNSDDKRRILSDSNVAGMVSPECVARTGTVFTGQAEEISHYARLTRIYNADLLCSVPHRSGSELLLGWSSAFINICITFPLNKMIFRQQLHGVTARGAVEQLIKEGVRNIYRGVLPPLIQKSGSVGIMFGSFDKIKLYLYEKETFSPSHPILTISVAAGLAGWCEALLMPFERVQTLLQDSKRMLQFKNTRDAFVKMKVYGYQEYYRGLSAILLRNGFSNVIFFSLRTPISHETQSLGAPKALSDFGSGAVLGAATSTVMYPLNTIKTHMQKHLGGPFHGVARTYHFVLRARGGDLKKLFRGVHLNCGRAFISWGIINMSYEYLRQIFNLGT